MEHKSFLLSADKNLLVIPTFAQTNSSGTQVKFAGVMTFRVTPNTIEQNGLIDHYINDEESF